MLGEEDMNAISIRIFSTSAARISYLRERRMDVSVAVDGRPATSLQPRRLLQFSTATPLNRAKSFTFTVTTTRSFTKAMAAI